MSVEHYIVGHAPATTRPPRLRTGCGLLIDHDAPPEGTPRCPDCTEYLADLARQAAATRQRNAARRVAADQARADAAEAAAIRRQADALDALMRRAATR